MRILPYILASLLGISGCVPKTAFDSFTMSSVTERAVVNLQTVTVGNSEGVEAIVSAIYLNAVYPQRYRGGEYFLIAYYDRGDENLLERLRLNETVRPTSVEEISESDAMCALVPIRNDWNRYYIVRFPKQGVTAALNVTFETGRCVTGTLGFQKGGV